MSKFITPPCPNNWEECDWCGAGPEEACLNPDYAATGKTMKLDKPCGSCRTPSTCKKLKICPVGVATCEDDLPEVPGLPPQAKETNPKDMAGAPKVSTSLVPELAIIEMAQAFRDGARKYGPYNWRDAPVRTTVYLDAMDRHLMLYRGGQDNASDSLLSHLTHVMSGCAILLDAALNGTLIDDRYKLKDPGILEDMLRHYKGANERRP